MSLSEMYGCGSKIDMLPGVDIQVAARLVRDWRKNHRHDGIKPEDRPPLGFNTNVVSTTFNDGEGDTEWQGMHAAPE